MSEMGPSGLTTGVREIDADTEGLCFLMSRLFDPLVECRRRYGECDHRQCTRIGAIAKYLDRSFRRQDDLMMSAGYPMADEHQAEHEALVEQLAAMQQACVCADRDRAVVDNAVTLWLLRHHRGFDRLLANWAVTRRVLSPAAE
ncbi:MAG TPA: hypothetical protein VL974_08045 [Magnetospirillum sp.]|jgi:hemerythrin-like metal-binding protein|nr:hypothetical protein [Magnetospirillum sp.]